MFKFFSNFTKAAVNDSTKGVQTFLATKFPDTASKADMMALEQNLDKFTLKVRELTRKRDKEKKDYDEIVASEEKMIAVAERWQSQLETAKGKAKTELSKKLNDLVGKIEVLDPKIEKEKMEWDQAEKALAMFKNLADKAAQKFKDYKANWEAAQNRMDLSEAKMEAAKMEADHNKMVAGIDDIGSSTTALDAMNAKADAIEDKADSMKLKEELLAGSGDITDDADFQAALDEIDEEENPKGDISDRLSSLKKRR